MIDHTDESPRRTADHSWVESVTLHSSENRTARFWGEELFSPRPRLVVAAIRLRNRVGGPLRLEPFGERERSETSPPEGRLGPFPVLSESDDRIEFGIADSHLTFRSELTPVVDAGQTRIVVTTRIWTHNLLGRCYATALRLGHPLVMNVFLRQLKKRHSFS